MERDKTATLDMAVVHAVADILSLKKFAHWRKVRNGKAIANAVFMTAFAGPNGK